MEAATTSDLKSLFVLLGYGWHILIEDILDYKVILICNKKSDKFLLISKTKLAQINT